MKRKQCWIVPLVAAALTVSAAVCQAQTTITYNFASDLEGWAGAEPTGQAATYEWNATGGSGGGGCMQIVMDGTTTIEIDPRVTLPTTINSAQYLSVSVHMKVDPASGTTPTTGYGNLQAIFRDASFSWNSMWKGAIYSPAANDWVTYTFLVAPPYNSGVTYLQFQLSGTSYSGPVTNYIDNVTITALPNPWVAEAFNNGNYDGTADAPFVNPITHATSTIAPAGAWRIDMVPGNWAWNQYNTPGALDSTRFQNIGLDIYVDSTSGTAYGGAQILLVKNGWSGNVFLGGMDFNASMVGKWTHFDFPCAVSGINGSPAIIVQGKPGADGGADTVTIHVDNIAFWSPIALPKFSSLKPNTLPGGVQIAVNGAGDQWNRDAIATPTTPAGSTNYTWVNQNGIGYFYTITNFPSPAAHPGFESHLFIVNEDTVGGVYNETYGGSDWNAADLALLRVENATNGIGVNVSFEWKTNMPAANAPNVISVTNLPSGNGTWGVVFSDDLNGSIVGPTGVLTNFTLPEGVQGNFAPSMSFLQFGVFKNDVQNSGVNDSQSAVFTHVVVTNSSMGVIFDDDFAGPGLTAKYEWRATASTRTQWIPPGTGYWLTWSLPDLNFNLQSAGNISGPWADAGASFSYIDGTGTNRIAAIPTTNLPAGDAAFFRLVKPTP